jgi:cytosine/adenosine deaminase-related metal-dependent hydrolase
MVNYISSSVIYPVLGSPIPNGVIGINSDGSIHSVLTATAAKAQNIENIKYYQGALVPGFINTHCHLELSHLKHQLEEKTGLTNFIKGILAKREQPEEMIISAMEAADKEMHDNGIVAVGDISNQLISREVKQHSKIYYHTFIEVFGFNAPAEQTIHPGLALKVAFEPLKASIVPHAPYSVSTSLFKAIREITTDNDLMSIHNQETAAENELFEKGTGEFAELFKALGIAQSEAHGSGKSAIHYHLPQLPDQINTLLVHNTFTNNTDLAFAKKHHQKLFWCLCPNANLYIEDRLPDVELFQREGIKITLGTDSLASNHRLDLLSEMKTLQDHKQVSFAESLQWATLNGAEFLGIDSQFGSLTVGKKPGIMLINLHDDTMIGEDTVVKRLF